jgi:TRAP-type mannitol/chloroaromatic compound transport system permease small subunit
LKLLLKIAHVIDWVVEQIGRIATWLVTLVILIGFMNVVFRYGGRFSGTDLFSDVVKTLTGQDAGQNTLIDLQWWLFSIIFFLGFAYILKHGVNVRVDFLYSKWKPKRRALVDFIGTLIFLIPFCLLGLYVVIGQIMFAWGFSSTGSPTNLVEFFRGLNPDRGNWEESMDAGGLPRAPIKTFIFVAFALLLLQSLSQAIKYLAIMSGHTEVEEEIKSEEKQEDIVTEVAERAKEVLHQQ